MNNNYVRIIIAGRILHGLYFARLVAQIIACANNALLGRNNRRPNDTIRAISSLHVAALLTHSASGRRLPRGSRRWPFLFLARECPAEDIPAKTFFHARTANSNEARRPCRAQKQSLRRLYDRRSSTVDRRSAISDRRGNEGPLIVQQGTDSQ